MNTTRILIIVLLALFSTNSFSQTAREISNKASNAVEINEMEMLSTLKIINANGKVREKQTATATRKFGEVTKTIVKFISPADIKGTAMLIYDYDEKDDDMWIFMPALRKIRRIVSSEKGKSFMGSEFTNADLSKPKPDDFIYKILSAETYCGKECWKIEATCKNEDIEDENGFIRKISWIEKTSYLTHRIESYDLDDELHKIQLIEDYRKQANGKFFAFYMEKENIQNGRKSIINIGTFQPNSNLPESKFTPAMLKN